MRIQFDKLIVNLKPPTSAADLSPVLYLTTPTGTFMSVWYAMLYVVVEGWRELGCHDPEIDSLLESKNAELLRRYRNAVCHYQKDWLDDRMTNFCASPDSVDWVRRLHSAFGRYFLAIYPEQGANRGAEQGVEADEA